MTLERLRKRGYEALLNCYEKIALSQFYLETAVYENRLVYPEKPAEGYSGVRGAPRQFIWWGGLLDYRLAFFPVFI